MFEFLQTVIGLVILFYVIRLKQSQDAAQRGPAPAAIAAPPMAASTEFSAIRARLDEVQRAVLEIHGSVADMQKDHEILDELEENVMAEWMQVIEEKLGKKPIHVPCPACGHAGGLEPNLLADEDLEYGCPSCGAIHSVDALRATYPERDL
jgi:hypothetical protein